MKTAGRVFKRLLVFLGSILLLSLVVFYISRLAPGDPVACYYGDQAQRMSPARREWAQERLGLNAPIAVQYVRWLENALQGNFGISYKYKRDVLEVIGERAGNTLLLGGGSFLLLFSLALLLGAACVFWEGRLPDRLLCRAGTVFSCIPEFWLSLLLILIFSVWLRMLPSSGAYSAGGAGGSLDRLYHLILPVAVLLLSHLWYYAYLVRSRLLAETREDYVLLARAKGLSRRKILFGHCLRGILPSYLSLMAVSVPHILGGTYIVEMVFSYPGLGTLAYESARYQDYNLLMLLCLLSGSLVIFCSLLSEAIGGRLDPRMHLQPFEEEKR
ncbi:MAG: ABC transporter permease [Provencibacterium sp.]|jgi:peptide/nickel transport system permease protein|nr:ABC transporter permease [Provencibacterium sp.]